MSLTTRVLIALVAGITIGLMLSESTTPHAATIVAIVEPVGTLFINAIRMTVIPLVFSLLVTGVASASSPAAIGRIGGRAIALFVLLLAASGTAGALLAPPILSRITIDPAAIERLRASASASSATIAEGARRAPTFAQWVTDLVPINPVKSAADGAMLPLIIFAMTFGLALLFIDAERRAIVCGFFRGISDAMLVVVRWVLRFAPIGVFALTLPLIARLGMPAIRVLASYVIVVSLGSALFVLLVVYPFAAIAGRISLGRFARAVLPAQAVAFTARSSLAALPALIEGARTRAGLREDVASFLLPLASAMFRVGAAIGVTTGALFIAKLYGVALGPTAIATIVMTAVVTSFSIPGVPGGSIIAMAPVLASVGLPLEGLGILLGVDTIPDSFRTTANVTGQMAVAVVVGRDANAPARSADAIAPEAILRHDEVTAVER